ncbi:MAG: hypothetical protein KDA75_20305, partial [Planctomycetaceae bacterium]|nr:hypothetical protein [Planctomycetaceae bacterium]
TAGSVVRVGSNSATGKSSEVWNLATGKRVGTIRKLALEGSEVFAISGDGAYFAAQPAHEHLLGVYDVAASKPLGGIKIEDWSGLKFVAFGVENRLVAFDDNRLKVYTMPDGNLVSTSEELDTWSGFEHAAMSPGGKYVAVHGRDGLESKIRLFNILTGYCDAQLALTREQDRCDGLAFTPNGEQLFLLTAGSRTQIHKFDMATGQQTGTMGLSADADQFTRYSSKFYDGPRLAVFPDGARVMLSGMYVFDAVSGDYLLQLPEDVKYWVGIVGDEQLAVLNGNKLVPWTLRAE